MAQRFLAHAFSYTDHELAELFGMDVAKVQANIRANLETDMAWLAETPLGVAAPYLLACEEGIAQAA